MGIKLLQHYPDGSSQVVEIESLPPVSGKSGLYLKTDGVSTSWETTPTELPPQEGHSGEVLITDGKTPKWSPATPAIDLSSPPPIGNVTPNTGAFSEMSLGRDGKAPVSTHKTNTVTLTDQMGTIFSYSTLLYTSGDFHIQVTAGQVSQVLKITSVVNGHLCQWTEFDSVQSNGEAAPLAQFRVQTDGGSNVLLVATPLTPSPTTFKVTALLTTI